MRPSRSAPSALAALVLALVPTLAACVRSAEAPAAAPALAVRPIAIGFSLDSLIVERWIRDRDVFVATANSLGADVIFQNAANDEKEQVSQIRYLIDKGVDVLVIIPMNADILTDAIQRAKSRGIRVISYDRLIRNAPVDLYVSVDSVEVGRIMARAIVKRAPAGDFVFINGPLSDHNVSLVREGQDSVLADYPGVSRILDYFADNWSYDLAYRQVAKLLDEGRRIDAIVCGNDGLAGGAIRALAERRLAGKVPVVGQDADIAACQYVVEGSQLITVYKPISALAKLAAQFAVSMAKGEFIAPVETIGNGAVDVPVYWLKPVEVTRENIDEVVIESGFHTADEIYRNIPVDKRPAAYR
jgi:D-xylose transport system substrate-binding protein